MVGRSLRLCRIGIARGIGEVTRSLSNTHFGQRPDVEDRRIAVDLSRFLCWAIPCLMDHIPWRRAIDPTTIVRWPFGCA